MDLQGICSLLHAHGPIGSNLMDAIGGLYSTAFAVGIGVLEKKRGGNMNKMGKTWLGQ